MRRSGSLPAIPSPSIEFMTASSDENLLFSMWALQLGFIDATQMVEAAGAWMFSREKPIGQIFVEKKFLTEAMKSAIDEIVRKHVARSGSIDKSLESLSQDSSNPLTAGDFELQTANQKLPKEWDKRIRELAETKTLFPPHSESKRFKIKKEIGHGGLGVVSEAYDTELGRTVAIKEIRYEMAMIPECRARFLTEAKITGLLDHPGIVPVYALGEFEDGRPYYAMRLIRGKNMSSVIREIVNENLKGEAFLQGIRPLLRHLIDACNTVEYAFAQHGLLHRDLKPSNIMIDRYGETIVVDWGLVKTTENASEEIPQSQMIPAHVFDSGSQPTADGQFRGTLSYMSPEQARGISDLVDHRSDIYGLGATLYNILIGKAPYPGLNWDGDTDYADLVRENRFTPPREIRKDIPAGLNAICLKAMATKREDRYQKASELAEDIDRWIAGDPVLALPEGVFKRMERWGRKHLVALASGLVLLSGLALGLAWINQVVITERDQARKSEERAIESRKLASTAIEKVVEKIGDNSLAQIPGMEAKRYEMLEQVVDEIASLLEQRPDDHAVKGDLVRTQLRLANIDRLNRRYEPAMERYLSIRQLIDSVPSAYRNKDREIQDDWSSYEIDLNYFMSEMINKTEGPKKALTMNQEVAPVAEAYMLRNQGVLPSAVAYARNHMQSADLQFDLGESVNARRDVEKAIGALEPLVSVRRGPNNTEVPDDPSYDELAIGMFYYTGALLLDGRCLTEQGEYGKALTRFEEGMGVAIRVQGFQIGLATGTNYLGRAYRETQLVYLKQADWELAASTYEKAMQIVERREENLTTKTLERLFIMLECDRARYLAKYDPAVAREALQRAEKQFAESIQTEGAAEDWELTLHLATARAAVASLDGNEEARRLAEQQHEEARKKIAEVNPGSPLLKELELSPMKKN